VELVIDDLALGRPLLDAQPEWFPHIDTDSLDALPLSADQFATEEFIQRLPLPLLAKPQRLRRVSIDLRHSQMEFTEFCSPVVY
jgi:hypothetical protein